MINWPIPTTVGEIYTSPNGDKWEWNGYGWDTFGSIGVTGPIGPTGGTGGTGGTGSTGATGTLPYKSYVAIISQGGTGAPTATVLENSLGGTVSWSRSNTGEYSATTSGLFTISKTVIFMQVSGSLGSNWGIQYVVGALDVNTIYLLTQLGDSSSTNRDGILNQAPIEIRVYT